MVKKNLEREVMDTGSIKKHNTERGYFEVYLEGKVILA